MPDKARLIAIGDIHGHLAALETLLEQIAPQANDTIVTIGDYVDRGPDSRGVIDKLLDLRGRCRLVTLLGNHDELMLEVCAGATAALRDSWLSFGGGATLASYGCQPEEIPPDHLAFLRECLPFHETDHHIFVHGNYDADLPLAEQSTKVLYWDSVKHREPGPHCSGKTAIVGHAAQKDGEILDLGYLKCIDTCCYGSGWLTALDVESGQVWQVDKEGKARGQGLGARD